jgi:formamidopyrimidine-DNA glycosylase
MPELPEVERVRRSLVPHLVGSAVAGVEVRRAEVVTGAADPPALLVGNTIDRVQRHGKQLAIIGTSGTVVCIHLGMTGSLRYGPAPADTLHTHVIWRLAGTTPAQMLAFRDPRRFGGVWTFPSLGELHAQRWSCLGADALRITPRQLAAALCRTRQPLKAALLDQQIVAGLGNIYVDELLFACGLSPRMPACEVPARLIPPLVRRMRALLQRAIASGGSTIRDYADGTGRAGGFQFRHRVYGRSGQPCRRCRRTLSTLVIAGRTTVCCHHCQPDPSALSLRKKKRIQSSSSP